MEGCWSIKQYAKQNTSDVVRVPGRHQMHAGACRWLCDVCLYCSVCVSVCL